MALDCGPGLGRLNQIYGPNLPTPSVKSICDEIFTRCTTRSRHDILKTAVADVSKSSRHVRYWGGKIFGQNYLGMLCCVVAIILWIQQFVLRSTQRLTVKKGEMSLLPPGLAVSLWPIPMVLFTIKMSTLYWQMLRILWCISAVITLSDDTKWIKENTVFFDHCACAVTS